MQLMLVVIVEVTGFCGNRCVVMEALSEEGDERVQHVASADDVMTLIREDLHRGERSKGRVHSASQKLCPNLEPVSSKAECFTAAQQRLSQEREVARSRA